MIVFIPDEIAGVFRLLAFLTDEITGVVRLPAFLIAQIALSRLFVSYI